MTMMQAPSKQRINIQPFDLRTQRDAFSVSLDGLKGVCYPAGAAARTNSVANCFKVEHRSIGRRFATGQGRPETESAYPVHFIRNPFSLTMRPVNRRNSRSLRRRKGSLEVWSQASAHRRGHLLHLLLRPRPRTRVIPHMRIMHIPVQPPVSRTSIVQLVSRELQPALHM